MATLGTIFGTSYIFTRGGNKQPASPPINASSSDEADFIKFASSPSTCLPSASCPNTLAGSSWKTPRRTRRKRSTRFGLGQARERSEDRRVLCIYTRALHGIPCPELRLFLGSSLNVPVSNRQRTISCQLLALTQSSVKSVQRYFSADRSHQSVSNWIQCPHRK